MKYEIAWCRNQVQWIHICVFTYIHTKTYMYAYILVPLAFKNTKIEMYL